MSVDDSTDRVVFLALVAFAVALATYGVLIQGSVLAATGFLLPLAFLYLFWRLVRGVDRIGEALEANEPRESE